MSDQEEYLHWTEHAAVAAAEEVLSPEAAQLLTDDHREWARTMETQQARWLVSNFYGLQKPRIRCEHQLRQASLFGARAFAGWLEKQEIEGPDLWGTLELHDDLEKPFLRVCDGRAGSSLVEHRLQTVPHAHQRAARFGQSLDAVGLDAKVTLRLAALHGFRIGEPGGHQPFLLEAPQGDVDGGTRHVATGAFENFLDDRHAVGFIAQAQDPQKNQLLYLT